jgi:sulfur carrier protein ThiS
MKVKINNREQEVPPGTKFMRVITLIRDSQKDDPVTQSLIAKTGHDQITFVLNGRIIKPREYASIEMKEGDDIRWMHPYAGG